MATLLELARAANTLVPSIAFMVVENSAQWKMLERTEKKTMKGHGALAMPETESAPEPSTIALLLVALAAIAVVTRFRACLLRWIAQARSRWIPHC